MVLGKLSMPGRPTTWMTVGQGPIALAVGALFGHFYSPLSPSLWETIQYRLKYCLKGPLNPKTKNQPTLFVSGISSVRFINYPCEPKKIWWDCAEVQSDFSVFCSCMR